MADPKLDCLIAEKMRIEKQIASLDRTERQLAKRIDDMEKQLDEHIQFFRDTLQKHIASRVAHNKDVDLYAAMLDTVIHGNASMTVSYSLYPIQQEVSDNG